MPLDPYNLTPTASINRVKFISAPGLPEMWQGKTAYEVMGREIIVQRMGATFPELAKQTDPIPVFCEQYLAQHNPQAETIADEMGQALGCLLLVLKRGEDANRIARTEWDDSYWAHWASIQHVIFGGGIMASLLGRKMVERATDMLKGLISLTIAQYPTALPLIGAARIAPYGHETSWVFDFGGTNLKRARAIYKQDQLVELEQLSSILIPTFHGWDEIFHFMVQKIIEPISNSNNQAGILSVNISMANYVKGCELASDKPYGAYGRLAYLGENFCGTLEEAIRRDGGFHTQVALVHDGTAAAKVFAGENDTAVITVGTALGVGFPPPNTGLWQLNEQFNIRPF